MSERALLIFADDNESMEKLVQALNAIKHPPYKPNPPGTPYGSPQATYTKTEVNKFALQNLREAMPNINFGGSVIVP